MSDAKTTGAYYTPEDLARFVAGRLAQFVPAKGRLRILDPAVGDGRLLDHMAQALAPRKLSLHGYDIDPAALAATRARFPSQTKNFIEASFLDHAVKLPPAGDLFTPDEGVTFDIVISNPPYVRTHWISEEQRRQIEGAYQLPGRADLSFAFILGISRVLRPGGMAALILSNRFLFTEAGAAIRRFVPAHFRVLEIWDMGDSKIFDAAVMPAVLILRKEESTRAGHGLWNRVCRSASVPGATPFFAALEDPDCPCGEINGKTCKIERGFLGLDEQGHWKFRNPTTDAWMATVRARSRSRFSDLGSIRVGIKTAADAVFLRPGPDEDFDRLEKDIVRPLVSSSSAQRWATPNAPERVLYPYLGQGARVLIDPLAYPLTMAYLESHRERLAGREYVTEGSRQWWEIWVSHKPSTWQKPLLAFKDISEHPVFFLTSPGTLVNGDCYFIELDPSLHPDMVWLAMGVANSTFITAYYDAYLGNKLYAGRRRFITQYVRDFPLPDRRTPEAAQIISMARELHANAMAGRRTPGLEKALNQWVLAAFGLNSPQAELAEALPS
jgi:adenine-specific DNA-methyltransferase